MAYKNSVNEFLATYRVLSGDVLVINPHLEVERLNKARGLLSAYGQLFVGDHGEELSAYMKAVGMPTDTAKHMRCYDAARRICDASRTLIYCEGFCAIPVEGGPQNYVRYVRIAHGWAVDSITGKVYGPTLSERTKKLAVYLGFGIRLPYADEWYRTFGYYGLLDGAADGSCAGVYLDSPQDWLATP